MALPRPERDWDTPGNGGGEQGASSWNHVAGFARISVSSPKLDQGRPHVSERPYEITQGRLRKRFGQLVQIFLP